MNIINFMGQLVLIMFLLFGKYASRNYILISPREIKGSPNRLLSQHFSDNNDQRLLNVTTLHEIRFIIIICLIGYKREWNS